MQDSNAFSHLSPISEECGNVFKQIREKHTKGKIKMYTGGVHFGYNLLQIHTLLNPRITVLRRKSQPVHRRCQWLQRYQDWTSPFKRGKKTNLNLRLSYPLSCCVKAWTFARLNSRFDFQVDLNPMLGQKQSVCSRSQRDVLFPCMSSRHWDTELLNEILMLCLHSYHSLHEWSLHEFLGYLGNELLNHCNSSLQVN